ncbi:MAG: hypothetical protein R3F60_24940 [bacterium]
MAAAESCPCEATAVGTLTAIVRGVVPSCRAWRAAEATGLTLVVDLGEGRVVELTLGLAGLDDAPLDALIGQPIEVRFERTVWVEPYTEGPRVIVADAAGRDILEVVDGPRRCPAASAPSSLPAAPWWPAVRRAARPAPRSTMPGKSPEMIRPRSCSPATPPSWGASRSPRASWWTSRVAAGVTSAATSAWLRPRPPLAGC